MTSKKDVLIGIDVGTSSTRVVAFDLRGETLAAETHDYPLLTPRPNWAEQNPDDWWEASRRGLRGVAKRIDAKRVAAISFSGQMHGSVFLDAADKVIRPALLWCDGRTAAECAEAMNTVGREKFLSIIKNPALTSFTLPKVMWLRHHEPKNFQRLATVLLPKDYVRFKLTGEKKMDVADGAGTAMMEVGRKRWANSVLATLGIDPKILPPLVDSSEIAGNLSAQAAKETGLPAGIPVVAGAGDQPAGATGVGVIDEGQLMVSLGTSGVIFAPTREAVLDPTLALATFDHAVPGRSYLMGCILSAGGSLQWYRNQLGREEIAEAKKAKIDPYDLLLRRASAVEAGAEGLFFLPYLMGERSPHNDPDARGAFIGLTVRHTKPHMTRAVVEGVSFALRDCLEAIRALKIEIREVRATGGGARSPFWMQTLSDILGVKVNCVASAEGPALGAAIMAGVGVGTYKDFASGARAAVRLGASFRPISKAQKAYEPIYRKFREFYPLLKGHF
ncbi:xylulokinase [Candidatus Sumerlaeota bacterium]|nr:xylulokinase [Candidatus Sumerlaeota bacterium]